jgi:hypothetical protein
MIRLMPVKRPRWNLIARWRLRQRRRRLEKSKREAKKWDNWRHR